MWQQAWDLRMIRGKNSTNGMKQTALAHRY
jgi:hypothetical protein